MGPATIDPYPMPTQDAVPRSVAPWSIDPDRAALLVHNMQNHLLHPFPRNAPPLVDLIGNIAALRRSARRLGLPVVFSAAPPAERPEQRGLAAEMETEATPQDRDVSITEELTPHRGEHVIANARHNAFLRSHLERILRTTGRDQLILCGVFAHSGVLLTAADAFMNDIQPFVVADAVADTSAEEHALALRWMAARGAVVRTTTILIDELEA
ncbi:isochorismatase family protein [Streptomyces sp. NBC_01310]|uniref:isochorismatase family protein n=1 Tax=Streptomyces sp. NBC_01310 TaxID=2903820 RepID=UPI0035B5CC68|nr:isochorismatase family protein [Streptomyces sp. NBC_01310]